MSSAKLLTVFGATGNQGGSLIATILEHPTVSRAYKIRAVTRDTSKPAAKALEAKGCETVKADLGDPASIAAAVKGAYAVFSVTDYWAVLSKEIEYKQGVCVADACIAAGVKHLVWSSVPHTTELTKGTLPNIYHFDSKADVEKYIEKHKGNMWASYFMPAFFVSRCLSESALPSHATYSSPPPSHLLVSRPKIAKSPKSGRAFALSLLKLHANARVQS